MEIFNPNRSAKLAELLGILTMGLSSSPDASDSEGPASTVTGWLGRIDSQVRSGSSAASLESPHQVPRAANSLHTPAFLSRLEHQLLQGDSAAEYAVNMLRRGALETYVEDAYSPVEGEFNRPTDATSTDEGADCSPFMFVTAPDSSLESGRAVTVPALSHSEISAESKVHGVAEEWLHSQQHRPGSQAS